MDAKSLPPGGDKRKDLFNRAVAHKWQLSLDRIDPGFWSLAMRLWKNTKYLRTELNRLGLNTGSSVTPIIPVIFEAEETMFRLAQTLHKASIFVAPVIFPGCPKNSPRLRFTVTSSHTIADIDEIIETLCSGP